MEPRAREPTGVGTASLTVGLHTQARTRASRGRFGRGIRAGATFLLGGLTTIEVLAVAIGSVAVVGVLWASHTIEPEGLVTDPWLRAGWILLVLALIRPVTWIPYLLPFVVFRRLFDALLPRRGVVLRNALANAAAMGVLGAVMWLVVAAVDRAGTAVLSALAFATGSGSYDTLGSFRGEWTAARVAMVVGLVVVGRLFLPSLGRDLNLSDDPVLGFADGPRGTVDRYLLTASVVGGAILGGVAVFLARS